MTSPDPLLGASQTRLEVHIMVAVPLPPQRGRLFGMSGRYCATSVQEDTGKAIHIAAKQPFDVPRGTDLRVTHGGDPYRREGENRERRAAFILNFYQRDVTDGTRSLLYVPLTRSQRGFMSDHCCGGNREHRAACFLHPVRVSFHLPWRTTTMMRCGLRVERFSPA